MVSAIVHWSRKASEETAMRAMSLCLVGIAVALISVIPANAQEAHDTKKLNLHQRRGEPASRQVKDQTAGQIYCKSDVPCRPVKKGCHLEHEFGGFNEEVCN
jgi:hypothetical protein